MDMNMMDPEQEKRRAADVRRKVEINRRNKDYRKKRIVVDILMGITLVVLVIGTLWGLKHDDVNQSISPIGIAIAIVFGVLLVVLLVLWIIGFGSVCPHCGTYWNAYESGGEFCCYCGKPLRFSESLEQIDKKLQEEARNQESDTEE